MNKASDSVLFFFFFNAPAPTEIYTLALHDALPILFVGHWMQGDFGEDRKNVGLTIKSFYETFKNKKKRSEEHTSELQSPCNLVCRLLLEKKKKKSNLQETARTWSEEIKGKGTTL